MEMTAALYGFLGTLVGAGTSIATTVLSTWLLGKKERESRTDQQRFDAEKWKREQLQAALLNAASGVDLYVARWLPYNADLARAQQDAELVKLSSELKRSMLAVLLWFPEKTRTEYLDLGQNAELANHNAIVLEKQAWAIRQVLIKLATSLGA
jgi:hypothetical protein